MRKAFIVTLALAYLMSGAFAAKKGKPVYERRIFNASRANSAPVINGEFDDPAWQAVDWTGDFVQFQPYGGAAPSQQTAFKILYDDNNLYVAMKLYDTSSDSIEHRLAQKDDDMMMLGDVAGIFIDSYFDHLTAFGFLVSAGGVKADFIWTGDGQNQDLTWDPIWYVKTRIKNDGWNAEMRIPLSQLRFGKSEKQVWGLQLGRVLYRKQEISFWQYIPQDAPGLIHLFGELHGIDGIKPKKQVEIAPYGVASTERFKSESGNPFRTGKGNYYNGGVDGKIGLTNNITMDFTVNPDFGQVEADPSLLNLSAYETFFEEKRPFFVEGKNIYNFQLMGGDGDLSAENLFYSRRIGRQPHGYPHLSSGEYTDMPDFTRILGAAKVSGKTKDGLSIGFLESVTAREKAEIDLDGERRFESVEPLTNYAVGRIQKDYGQGRTSIGGIITSVNRDIENPNLNWLHKSAYTGGLDFSHSWNNRNYNLTIKTYFSQVNGDSTALIRTQRASAHYFQRPDATYLKYDSSRTSLMGNGGRIQVGKIGGGHWQYLAFLTWKTPGLELNDVGYMRTTDEILQIFWVGYRIWEPFSIFRNFSVNVNQWSAWDFGGNNLVKGGNVNFHTQFKNYWRVFSSVNFNSNRRSNALLRGGPSFLTPGSAGMYLNVGSDDRKKLSFNLSGSFNEGFENSSTSKNISGGLTYRPTSTISITLRPKYSAASEELQYVTKTYFNNDERYIFAHINQKVLEMSIRLNVSITPNLNIQYWGQPFIAAGEYSDFKRVTEPHAGTFTDRYHTFDNGEITYDTDGGYYAIDEDLDGNTDYAVGNPDFNFKTFKSNLVLRWEYVPGSNLYLVWSQDRNQFSPAGTMDFGTDLRNLANTHPHNIFLIKLSYRFSL
ncbi:MAG: carbohydrate binding family 9 domain-containing protein [Chlorobi bacterium]|nr:carbohydrate binding family 9 domain-containing protein [Chlorobiota bacterium]